MKQLEVTILGQSYLLACPDGGEQPLQAAVAQVDREMSAIRDAGKVKARERIAVLAALNLAYQLAERPLTNASPAASTAPSVPQPPSDLPEAPATATIQQLITRIDAALGDDGLLL